MAKILLVEDDLKLADTIVLWFRSQKYVIEHTANGKQALELITFGSYEAIILDWDLPEIDGLSLCKILRDQRNRTPILMLTGKSEVDDKIEGLDEGVDDYLTKPFDLKELEARLRALLRRFAGQATDILSIADLKLDSQSRRVTKDGRPVVLTPREFSLLEFLLRNKNQIFSSDDLLHKLWHTDSDSSREAVRVCIGRLRQRLDDSENEDDSIIETVPKVGYRIRQI